MKYRIIIILMILLAAFSACQPASEPQSFMMAVDWRYTAMPEYRTEEYFLGALLAIKELGAGMFMISPGDIEPPDASRELISQVLGEDYLWYPAMGNHELEDQAYIDYLRAINAGEKSLPNIVRKGPVGCEETTYAFEVGDCHIAVLNQYFDGVSDIGTDGNMVPELLAWLEEDLKSTTKPFIFVAGHEPLVSMPDMGNGRIRHQGDSLDKYPQSAARFLQLMRKYNVTAYLTGHTHNTSIGRINGVWQIDAGHARGTEGLFPDVVFNQIYERMQLPDNKNRSEESVLMDYFKGQEYNLKKVLDYAGLTGDVGYKKISDTAAFPLLLEFYRNYRDNDSLRRQYDEDFEASGLLTQSSFVRIVLEKPVRAEVYRNDARGGQYQLTYTEILN